MAIYNAKAFFHLIGHVGYNKKFMRVMESLQIPGLNKETYLKNTCMSAKGKEGTKEKKWFYEGKKERFGGN